MSSFYVKLGIFTHHGSQATAKKRTHDTHALLSFPLWLQSPLSLLMFAKNGSLNSPYEGGIYKHNPFNFQWAWVIRIESSKQRFILLKKHLHFTTSTQTECHQ